MPSARQAGTPASSASPNRPAAAAVRRWRCPSAVTTTATAARTISPPASAGPVSRSPANNAPSATATAGLTYAYVETTDTGACPSSQTYAVKATRDPKTIR